MPMNEEEVKTKIVLPYLKSLGLRADELSFESSFSLQIGGNKVTVNGGKSRHGTVRGRSDTLVKRGGKNLLVLELKESDHVLTDDDRDQAVSYARLVHPVAPYALVTNGMEWKIFDTLTKEEPQHVAVKDAYQLVLPEAVRDEALRFFLGYSINNLLMFCRAQVDEQLKPLIGSPRDLSKKYVPELTTPRNALLAELESFEKSKSSCFLVLAESGAGKTSALCDYARRNNGAGKPTLFFWGASIETGLLPALAGEFGWTFSEDLTPVVLLRRLSDLTKELPVVVVIDAIDEWTYPQRAASLVTLLRGCRDLNVKFVFSCRTVAWEDFSQSRGSDIGFGPYLFCSSGDGVEQRGFQLGPLSDEEFFPTIHNYRDVFGIDAWFEDKALDEARRTPFLLRVMFAVAAASSDRHLTFSSREFFERYLDLILRKCGRREQAEEQIFAIARLMFEKNEECVSDRETRRALSLSAAESLMPALFEENILQRRGGGYTFYFQHLRDFIIAFKICDWASARPDELAAVKRDGVHRDALAFYLRYATPKQTEAAVGPVWRNAHEYVRLYAALVQRHFPNLDHVLVPGEKPALGFIAEYVVHRGVIGAYGFRRRHANEPAVVLVPVDKFLSRSNLLLMNGAGAMHHHGSTDGFTDFDIRREVLENELISRVMGAIKERRLNLRGCDKLAKEALVSAVHQDRRLFGTFVDSYARVLKFPFAAQDVNEIIQRAKLRCHFEHVARENRRRKPAMTELSDRPIQHGWRLSLEEEAEVSAAIDRVMATPNKFPELRAVSLDIRDLEAALRRTGALDDCLVVEQTPWFTNYGLSLEVARSYENGTKFVEEHIRLLYEEFLRSYRIVVDTNFPNWARVFPLRAQMPVRLFVSVDVNLWESRHSIEGGIVTACEPLPAGSDNEVVMCSYDELVPGGPEGIRYKGRVITDHYHVGVDLGRRMYSVGALLLTDMVYGRIFREWPVVANQLRRMEGIPLTDDEDRFGRTISVD